MYYNVLEHTIKLRLRSAQENRKSTRNHSGFTITTEGRTRRKIFTSTTLRTTHPLILVLSGAPIKLQSKERLGPTGYPAGQIIRPFLISGRTRGRG